jgi:hypothetical protein
MAALAAKTLVYKIDFARRMCEVVWLTRRVSCDTQCELALPASFC